MSDTFKTGKNNVEPLRIACASAGVRHVFVRDYETTAEIGVFSEEEGRRQRVRFNVDLTVTDSSEELGDRYENVVCYNRVVQGIETILKSGHIALVETLAERIASMNLQDHRVEAVRVRVEKLEAVEGAASVGVEIERRK